MRCAFGAYVLSFAVGLLYYLTLDKPIRNLDRMVLFPSKISDSFLIKKTNRHKGKVLKSALKQKKAVVGEETSIKTAETSLKEIKFEDDIKDDEVDV